MKITFKQHSSLLMTYLKPQWLKVSFLVLLLFTSIGIELINPQFLGHFIDAAQAKGNLDILIIAALTFIALVIGDQAATTIASYLSEDVSWVATNALRADLTLYCLNLDMSFHKAHTAGELIERVDGDISMLTDFFSTFVFRVFSSLLLLIGIIGVIFYTDWRIGLLLLIFSIFIVFILRRIQGIAVPHYHALRQASAELSSFSEERLSSTEDIRANGAQAYVMLRLYQLLRRILHTTRLSSIAARLFSGTIEISLAVSTAAVLTFGAYLLRGGQMSLGTVYLTFYYTNLLTQNLADITRQINQLQRATASIQRITELYYTPNAIVDGPGDPIPVGQLSIQFNDVSFGYTSEKTFFQDISFELCSGKTLGLLGRTGSGKTTLTRLLYRAYDVTNGSIQLGGVDIRRATLNDLRTRIGVVTQDVQLFQSSIRNNLTFFDQSIPDEHIKKAIVDLNLSDWYASLPDGLDTIISGSSALSAGEAQLLAFTRVFLQNPDIIILDEASSRLDPVTEKLIESAIRKLLEGRTGIIIAHHLETVQHADKIMILEDGTICEYGDRIQLATDPNSRFSYLLKTGITEVLA